MFRCLIFSIIAAFLFVTSAQAASFDCKKAVTKTEKMICGSSKLSELDKTLHEEYVKAIAQACDANGLREAQLTWIKYRDTADNEEALATAYKERIEWLAIRNNPTTTRFVTVNKALGKYRFSLTPKGCWESRLNSQLYTLSILSGDGSLIQNIELHSSQKPEDVFFSIDIDGDGYKDLKITKGYAAGPFPITTLYRFNRKNGMFEEDTHFPSGEGFATPSKEPGCVYVEQRQHGGPEIGYDYLITKWCLSRETNTWDAGETCSLAHNKECYQRLDSYSKEWYRKYREQIELKSTSNKPLEPTR